MEHVINTYTVRPDQLQPNLELLREFFAELARARPDGLRYSAYQRDDELSFVHLVHTDAGAGPFAALPSYRAFRTTIEQRCTEPPASGFLHLVGSYTPEPRTRER